MKYDLSILIPARNEMFLSKTVEDILKHKEGKTEIIVGLDGQWANPGIEDHLDVTLVYYPESIGQRAMTNQLCKLSKAKYIMKIDAHCSFDQGFDVKLMADMKDDWTMVPIMRNLHSFNWVCPNGHTRYQGPSGVCTECGKETTRDVVWIAKRSPQSRSYCFDSEPHFQYFNEYCKRPEYHGDLTETMSLQGSCFMITRDKYWELNICDETFGSWGSQGLEVAIKTWLSGGKVIVNHRTWYAHMFRTQGGDFGFPYEQRQSNVEKAKGHARELFFYNKWANATRPLSWLVEKFWPVRGWTDEDLKRLKDNEKLFYPIPMISLCIPTRARGEIFKQMCLSALKTASYPESIEFVTYHDNDDKTPYEYIGNHKEIYGERALVTVLANECQKVATGPIYMFSGDDYTFETPGWDDKVREVFDNYPDKIVLVCPNAGNWDTWGFGTIGFLHKNWVDAIGHFLPPYPEASSADKWINEVADTIGRRTYLSDVKITHSNINDQVHRDKNRLGIKTKQAKKYYIQEMKDKRKEEIKILENISGSKINSLSKGIIYYTDNQLGIKIAHKVQNQLKSIGLPIVSSSLKPMPHFGSNIYLPLERGISTMYKQILAALEASNADIVFFCEHDVLYHKSHFDFMPIDRNTFYYNVNVWKVRIEDGHALWVDNCIQVSGLCGYREELIKHYKERVLLSESGKWDRNWGYEPGTPGKTIFKIQFNQNTWMSEFPNIDIRHNHNLTKNRWSQDLFRNKKNCLGWTETTLNKINGWQNLELKR